MVRSHTVNTVTDSIGGVDGGFLLSTSLLPHVQHQPTGELRSFPTAQGAHTSVD